MIALCALLLGAAVPQTLPPSPLPGVTATPTPVSGTPGPAPSTGVPATPAATGAPQSTASPSPTATAASPAPSPLAAATASPYHYRFVPHQPAHPAPGTPQIYAVYLNDQKLRSLGPIDIRVETNPEVVKVISRSNGRDGVVPLVAPGVFEVAGRLPKIPFIAEGMSIDLQFIATTADGRKVTVGVPVRLN